jgi:DNA polymerase-3 subunit epsilon
MYAIVDIETTGGSAERSKITEIAIIIHDGEKAIQTFSTLVNPECRIPYQITQFTGITDEMVKDAPKFYEVAKEIVELTQDCVFVAHNVKFDYGFVKAAFKELGYDYQRKTLCTVRLSRNTFPGLPSYSLGKLCNSLNIQLKNRHRALGDAEATALLFSKMVEKNANLLPNDWLNSELQKLTHPPLLGESVLEKIPYKTTGVYYFHNKDGEVIYVGKSIDIKKRLIQHFANQKSQKVIRMQHEIADISFEPTGSELVALLLESDEIKKLKPLYNRSQKRTRSIPFYGIFEKIDEQGYINLYTKKLQEDDEPILTIDNLVEAKNTYYKLIEKYNLCLSKADIHKTGGACFNYQIHICNGACINKESDEMYNDRASKAIESISFKHQSFLIVDKGKHQHEKAVIYIDKGVYKGFGFIDMRESNPTIEDMKDCIKKYSHNKDIQTILYRFVKNGIKKTAI